MPIRPIGTPTPIATNTESTQQQPTIKTRPSKGIAETLDSFEPHQGGISDMFSTFGGANIGPMIGEAIGDSANDGNEEDAKTPKSKNSFIQMQPGSQMQSMSANDEAMDLAKKQKELIDNEKEPRRQTYSLQPSKPDRD